MNFRLTVIWNTDFCFSRICSAMVFGMRKSGIPSICTAGVNLFAAASVTSKLQDPVMQAG